jgi:hypothetical protein
MESVRLENDAVLEEIDCRKELLRSIIAEFEMHRQEEDQRLKSLAKELKCNIENNSIENLKLSELSKAVRESLLEIMNKNSSLQEEIAKFRLSLQHREHLDSILARHNDVLCNERAISEALEKKMAQSVGTSGSTGMKECWFEKSKRGERSTDWKRRYFMLDSVAKLLYYYTDDSKKVNKGQLCVYDKQ